MLLFDIETGPLPEDQIAHLKPEFEAPKNLKDPEKIAKAIADKEAKWLEDAALHPMTGFVVCITTSNGTYTNIHDRQTEAETIALFWRKWEQAIAAMELAVGWNIFDFDIPFLLRRSWLLGVEVPAGVQTVSEWNPERLQWHRSFRDLLTIWRCGKYQESSGGLDGLCKAFSLPTKPFAGKDFFKTWGEDNAKAREYCITEMQALVKLAEKMGVSDLPTATRNMGEALWV